MCQSEKTVKYGIYSKITESQLDTSRMLNPDGPDPVPTRTFLQPNGKKIKVLSTIEGTEKEVMNALYGNNTIKFTGQDETDTVITDITDATEIIINKE